MAFFTAASKADFQHQLQAALAQHISEQALPQVALFAEQFFGIISLDELTQRRLSDLAGCTLSAWRLLERFDHAQPQVRVYNPDYERHGWQSTHTAVEVLHHDLPFLVDSVRTELNRRGYSIHTLQTTVLSVRRGSKGELLEILPKGTQGDDILQESLMYLEIDRCANAAELNVLSKELEQVLGEVRVAVADFEPMKAKVQEILTKLDNSAFAVDADEKNEIKSFLEWLVGNHFTFLGYEEFLVTDQADGGHIEYDQNSFLGLTKLLRTGLTYDDLRIEDYAVNYLREPTLLSFAKAAHPSRVHRPAYPDYVSIREIDADGNVIKEHAASWACTPRRCMARACGSFRTSAARSRKSNTVLASRPRLTWARNWLRCVEVLAPRRSVPDAGGRAVQHRDVDRADPGTQQDPRVPAQRSVRPFLLLPGLRAA
jgi:glutamate dehydrogenase